MPVLDRVDDGLIYFDDGSSLSLPPGVEARWEETPAVRDNAWMYNWTFWVPSKLLGKPYAVTITDRTTRPEKALVEAFLARLAEQKSVREYQPD